MKTIQSILAAGFVGLTSASFASNAGDQVAVNCWQSAGEQFGVDSWLLYAIAKVESGFNPVAVNRNVDGTEDIGLMQINSQWLNDLATAGIERDDLFDPCINIHVGAWILKQSLETFRGTWNGVGAYNAGTKRNKKQQQRRSDYASRVFYQYCVTYGVYHGPC